MGWNTWLVSAYAWQKEMEPGDWLDEPNEEVLRSVQVLSQTVRGSEERARDIVQEKLKQMGYVEDEAGFLKQQQDWLLSRGHKVDKPWHEQTFSDNTGEYKVPDILAHAKRYYPQEVSMPVALLLHNLEPSEHETGDELPGHPEFIERAIEADLSYPILVIDYQDEEPRYWIADGVHRLWKAVHGRAPLESIQAHIVPSADLINLD